MLEIIIEICIYNINYSILIDLLYTFCKSLNILEHRGKMYNINLVKVI